MSFPNEQAMKKEELENYLRMVTDLIETEPGTINTGANRDVTKFLEPILATYGLEEIHMEMSRNVHGVKSVIEKYKDQVLFVLKNEIEKLDPLRRHRIFQTRISDMTGYEYQAYLEYLKESETRGPIDSGG